MVELKYSRKRLHPASCAAVFVYTVLALHLNAQRQPLLSNRNLRLTTGYLGY